MARKRFVHLIALFLLTAFASRGASGHGRPATPAQDSSYLFGVVNDNGTHFADEWARGVRATTLELQWRLYEPAEGVYDTLYIAEMQAALAVLKAQGWYVQLVPGYQYAPAWVFSNYAGMRYVNQYGEAFTPDPLAAGSSQVLNAPFNPQARALIAGYIARIFQDFNPADFDSVRVGGGIEGELRYPPPDWNGHANSYWAFDLYAQDPAVSGIPASVVGWRPGIDANPGSVGRGQLLVNPGFETTHTIYAIPGWSPDDEVSAETVTSLVHSGWRALQVTIASAHRVHQFVAVQPGTAYEFGGWLKSGDGAGRARLFLNQYDSSFQPVAGASFGLLETESTSWTSLSGTLVTAPTTRFLKVELDGSQPGTYFFDDLWLKAQGANSLDRDIAVPAAFYDWYVQQMIDFQNWQIDTMRAVYQGKLDVLYAGKGVLPNQVTDALTNDLRGDGWSEGNSGLYSAATYDRHVAALAGRADVNLYLTDIDEPLAALVDDASPYPGRWSGARWLASLGESAGLPVWGENSGQDDYTKMQLTLERMATNGYLGVMWAFESELYASPNGGYATMDQYEPLIHAYQAQAGVYLPLLRSSH